jgi:hypothetical protein
MSRSAAPAPRSRGLPAPAPAHGRRNTPYRSSALGLLGLLRVAGGIFGATPIALPITPPVADLADDPQAEVTKIFAFGKALAERMVTRRAEDWLKSKLSSP